MTSANPRRGLRKFRFERLVGRYVANPAVRLLKRVGATPAMVAELETTGRRSGHPRRIPVAATVDPTGAWLISQHGRRSGWAHNISADPRVRLRYRDRWFSGTAAFVDEDDVVVRSGTFARHPLARAATRASFRALQSNPVSVRITFAD